MSERLHYLFDEAIALAGPKKEGDPIFVNLASRNLVSGDFFITGVSRTTDNERAYDDARQKLEYREGLAARLGRESIGHDYHSLIGGPTYKGPYVYVKIESVWLDVRNKDVLMTISEFAARKSLKDQFSDDPKIPSVKLIDDRKHEDVYNIIAEVGYNEFMSSSYDLLYSIGVELYGARDHTGLNKQPCGFLQRLLNHLSKI